MAEKRKLEFFLLRYVPDAVKGEFVNIGLAMIEMPGSEGRFADVRFTRDWRRVQCLDPQADLDMLEAIEKDFRERVLEVRNCEEVVKALNDSFSNVIQISGAKGCLAEDPAKEIEEMAKIYLESARVWRLREPAGRLKILQTMRDEFEKAGVLRLLKAVPAEPYTKPGDPFEFDFGYRVGSEMKLFHAVSMRASVDSAVLLAARYPKIVPVMAKMTGTAPLLTAVVEAELDRTRNEIGFALEMMEESRIRVAGGSEMPGIAEVARRELAV